MATHQSDIVITPEAPSCAVLIVHGYSGGNDAFGTLADTLSKECNAQVIIPLLPGHGTNARELIPYEFDDFAEVTRRAADQRVPGIPLICVGYCYGGYIIGALARELEASALVFAITPYSLRFPLTAPGLPWIFSQAPLLKKYFTKEDIKLREGIFYYRHIPGKSLSLSYEGIRRMDAEIPSFDMPMLTLHNTDDPVTRTESGTLIIEQSLGNTLSKSLVFERGRHTMFFGPYRDEPIRATVDFVRSVLGSLS